MKNHDLSGMLTPVEAIAREAGDMLREEYYKPRKIEHKGTVDLVTQADRRAEQHIISRLQSQFASIPILAEEEGRLDGDDNDLMWVIDPLDGTTNFAHAFPVFAVSIALRRGSDVLLGVVHDPLRDECFSAVRGAGTTLNDQPVHVSGTHSLEQSLLATGFPYDRLTADDNNSDAFALFLRRGQGLRRAGAAALDLAYVAAGRLDGYWEMRLSSWDVAAGVLLVQEAGGRVTDYSGQPAAERVLDGEEIIASNGKIHQEMVDTLTELYD